jgi:hypothetical protein
LLAASALVPARAAAAKAGVWFIDGYSGFLRLEINAARNSNEFDVNQFVRRAAQVAAVPALFISMKSRRLALRHYSDQPALTIVSDTTFPPSRSSSR